MPSEIEIAEHRNANLHDELEVATARISNLEAKIGTLGSLLRQHRCNADGIMSVGECVDACRCSCTCGMVL